MGPADGKSLFQAVETESAISVSEHLQELSGKPETSLKSAVNQRNENNQSALHISCSKLSSDVTQILLEAGADPNVQDSEGKTPAFLIISRVKECNCEDCTRKAIRCLTILSIHGGSLDIPNSSGTTPLFMCAEHRFVECAKALLENGAALGTAKGRPMIEILVEKVPAVLETVFDRAVKIKGNKTVQDPEFELTFDLGAILPPQITLNNQLHASNGNINQVFPAEQWFSEKYQPCEEMTFLKRLLNYSENDSTTYKSLLRHPLVNVFTDLKWKSLEVLYIFFLTMQVLVLAAYSAFICATIFLDCPYDLYIHIQRGLGKINTQAFGENSFNASVLINPDKLCEIGIISKGLSLFVVCCTVMILLKEVQHAMYDMRDYLKDIFNYFQLVGFCSVIFTVVIAWDPNSHLYSLFYPVAAFGVAVSWCQIFVQIGRIPRLAIYIEMFVKISGNFCFSMAIYSFLLVGFAMSFSILFPAKPQLLDLPLSMIKVLTMLVGELDYDNLFNDDEMVPKGGGMSEGNNTTADDTLSMQHRFAGHVWYVTFVIFITLVLMNLLVGLAVSDIQGIRKHAEIYVIKRRVRYIAYLEKSLFEGTALLPGIIRKFLRENVAIARSSSQSSTQFLCCFGFFCSPVDLKKCKLTIHPNDQKFRLLSNESKSSIRQWVLAKSFNNKTRKCTGASRAESSTGFRQRNIANFRKGSMISFVGQQQLFVKDSKQQSDTERLKRLEFNVQQIDKKMNELDLKLDAILKTILRPDSPDNM